MTAQQKFNWLFSGILLLLAMSSVITSLLRARLTTASGQELVRNLRARIRGWWIMMAIFAVAFLFGQLTTILLFALISFCALREVLTLTPTRPGDHRALSVAFFLLLPLQYGLLAMDWYGAFTILIPVYGFLLLPSLAVIAQDTGDFLERCAKIQWGVMIAIYCISHVPALLLLQIPGYEGQNALLLFFLLLVVQMSDVLQYVCGKSFGRRKIAADVSPGKTVEGFLGGGAGAVLIGTGMWWITPFSPWQAALMSLVIVIMGFLGGLVLSAVKRSLGAKDWGTMIQGHGGMMDRMDSVSFAAPIFFHLTRYYFTL